MELKQEKEWYAVSSYSSHENKVKENLEKRIETQGLQDYIFRVVVAEHEVPVMKDGKPTGKTKIKAFRAYFTLQDVLSSVENANAKISFSINDEATSIDGINSYRVVDGVYDLSGRKIQLENGDMNKLQKGVYIINGQKVTVK
jgi:transcription antitermination factor NusG